MGRRRAYGAGVLTHEPRDGLGGDTCGDERGLKRPGGAREVAEEGARYALRYPQVLMTPIHVVKIG